MKCRCRVEKDEAGTRLIRCRSCQRQDRESEWDEEYWHSDFVQWCEDHPEVGDDMNEQVEAYYASFPRK